MACTNVNLSDNFPSDKTVGLSSVTTAAIKVAQQFAGGRYANASGIV